MRILEEPEQSLIIISACDFRFTQFRSATIFEAIQKLKNQKQNINKANALKQLSADKHLEAVGGPQLFDNISEQVSLRPTESIIDQIIQRREFNQPENWQDTSPEKMHKMRKNAKKCKKITAKKVKKIQAKPRSKTGLNNKARQASSKDKIKAVIDRLKAEGKELNTTTIKMRARAEGCSTYFLKQKDLWKLVGYKTLDKGKGGDRRVILIPA